jgi:hypothetical protein
MRKPILKQTTGTRYGSSMCSSIEMSADSYTSPHTDELRQRMTLAEKKIAEKDKPSNLQAAAAASSVGSSAKTAANDTNKQTAKTAKDEKKSAVPVPGAASSAPDNYACMHMCVCVSMRVCTAFSATVHTTLPLPQHR